MKSSILLAIGLFFLLLLAGGSLLAQSNNQKVVLRYAAFCQKKKTDARFSEWEDINDVIKVVMDFDKMVVQFFNQQQTKFDLLSQTQNGKDKNGDDFYDYRAIDEEGLECEVRLIVDKDDNTDVYLYAYYTNVTFGFYLKR